MILTPLKYCVMIPINARLDEPTMEGLLKAGHSRIPVYKDSRHNVIGVVIVKTLLTATPGSLLSDIPIRGVPRVEASTPLFSILHEFARGGSHMAGPCLLSLTF
jgi:metal transporter CNNM